MYFIWVNSWNSDHLFLASVTQHNVFTAQCWNMSQHFILFYSWIIFYYMSMSHFVYPSILFLKVISTLFGLLWIILLWTNTLCDHMFSVHVFVWAYVFNLLGYVPNSEIFGSYNFMFNFLRNCQSIFHRGSTIFHSHQQCAKVPVFAHLCQHLLFFQKYTELI